MPGKNPKVLKGKLERQKSAKHKLLSENIDSITNRNKEIVNAMASAAASAARPNLANKILTIQSDLDEPKGASKFSKDTVQR